MKLSVIIPNYNRASLIGETIRSVLLQSRPPDEVIIVDDGSTDGSRETIREFLPRVRLITQENSGPAAARNRGVAEATGDVIQFLDSDDLCFRNKFEEQLRELMRTGADMAYSPYVTCKLGNGVAHLCGPMMQARPLPNERSALRYFAKWWGIYLQACLFRRNLILKAGTFEEKLMPTEDYEFLLRVFLARPTMVHVSSTGFLYRLHTEDQLSFSQSGSANRARDYVNYICHVREHLRKHRSQISWLDRAGWWVEGIAAQRAVKDIDRVERHNPHWRDALGGAPLLCKKASSIIWQISRKFHGRVYRRSFGEGQLDRRIAALIMELGYEPRVAPQWLPALEPDCARTPLQ
jgi:glycosyltransferase involved in cell wall biosynthesis